MKKYSAFTLIEVLIILALATVITGIGLTSWNDSYSRELGRSNKDYVLAALIRARAQSMSGVCLEKTCSGPKSHGVYIAANAVVIFEGSDYSDRLSAFDESLPLSENVRITGPSEIVFASLSGTTSKASTIILSQRQTDLLTETLTIDTQGDITTSPS